MAFIVKRPNVKDTSKPFTGIAEQFEAWLLAQGLRPDPKKGLVIDGKIGRAYVDVDGTQKLVGWYQLWVHQAMPFGRCGDYRVDPKKATATWKPENEGAFELTDEMKAEIRALQEEAERDRVERQTRAAIRAQRQWEEGTKCDLHPYLQKKGCASHGLRVSEAGLLMIPMLDEHLKVVGLQFIDDGGQKRFLTGSKKKGSFFVIGEALLQGATEIAYVEGYATGASYFEDHGKPTVVCFDAYNLEPVSETMGKHFTQAKHLFIADFDDSQTGEREAVKAASRLRSQGLEAEVLIPESKGDYNDHKQAVEGELLPALKTVDIPINFEWQKSDRGRFLNSKENVLGVLKVNDISVWYNVIKKRMEIQIPNQSFIADLKEEAALIEIEDRCIQLGIPHTRVRDYLKLLAEEYNPVRDWIESEPWDGTERLQAFLDTIESPQKQLKETLMTKWLISCVAAACEPNGIELEGILVFQGAQGLGKTLWFKRLADYDQGWLLEGATLNPSDKDSVKQAVSHWIVELGEIESTFKKSDIDQLKAFVTKKTDELRLPYDRGFTIYQRRTAWYASVNAREFLTDSTGNRRFWVVPVSKIHYDHKIDMQQLWAEVHHRLYKPGVRNWFLTSEERAALQDSNELYRTQSSVEDLLLEHVNFTSQVTEPVQMTKLLRDLGINNPRAGEFKEAARVLSAHGIEPRRSNGRKVYDLEYTIPTHLSRAQPGGNGTPLGAYDDLL